MSKKLLKGIGLAVAAGVVAVGFSVAPARAQMAEPVIPPYTKSSPAAPYSKGLETVRQYHEAVEAAVRCDGRKFSLDEETKIAEVIAKASGTDYYTGGLLTQVHDGRDFFGARILSFGCKDQVVQDRLAFFRSNIQSAM